MQALLSSTLTTTSRLTLPLLYMCPNVLCASDADLQAVVTTSCTKQLVLTSYYFKCIQTLFAGGNSDIETGGEPQVLQTPFEDPDAVPMGMVQRSTQHKQWWRVAGRQLLDVAVPEERR
jgi:hypothetical protein